MSRRCRRPAGLKNPVGFRISPEGATWEKSMLDDLSRIEEVLRKHAYLLRGQSSESFTTPEMHCVKCGAARRMVIQGRYSALQENSNETITMYLKSKGIGGVIPALLDYTCVQCVTRYTVLIYQGPTGPALAVLPTVLGGLTTPNTPERVAYYLDQAHKSHCVGANSAAVAMFRAALDHLLFEQGYKKGMTGEKVTALEKGIAAGTAPKWARELDPAFLGVLTKLGAGSIHPNDGDVKKQEVFDNALIAAIKATFAELLDTVYEADERKAARLSALKEAAEALKKPPA